LEGTRDKGKGGGYHACSPARRRNISHIGGKCGSELTGLLGFDSGWEMAKSLLWGKGGSGEFISLAGCGVGLGLISRCRCGHSSSLGSRIWRW